MWVFSVMNWFCVKWYVLCNLGGMLNEMVMVLVVLGCMLWICSG